MRILNRDGNKVTVLTYPNNLTKYIKVDGEWYTALGVKVSESRSRRLDGLEG